MYYFVSDNDNNEVRVYARTFTEAARRGMYILEADHVNVYNKTGMFIGEYSKE